MEYLGDSFDIHTGGIDHIPVHHTNEIAQSEAAFGAPLANVWMHGEFLQINSSRMGKSEGNFITLDTLKGKGFPSLDYRYFCLTAHYRTQLNFTWESLEAAHSALARLYNFASLTPAGQVGCAEYERKFIGAINDDLNIPAALGIAWRLIDDDNLPDKAKINSLFKFDKVFGLNLGRREHISVPQNIESLLLGRKAAREQKDFKKSDDLRNQIEELGYEVMDTPEGQKIRKKLDIHVL